jgi:hypothetical protein
MSRIVFELHDKLPVNVRKTILEHFTCVTVSLEINLIVVYVSRYKILFLYPECEAYNNNNKFVSLATNVCDCTLLKYFYHVSI